jgi:hypothetical protein
MAATLKDYLKNRDDVVKAKKALDKAKGDLATAKQALTGLARMPSGKQSEATVKSVQKRLDEAEKAAATAKEKADKVVTEATDYFNKYKDKITAASKAISDKASQENIDAAKALVARYQAQGLDTTVAEKKIKDAEDKLAGVGKYKPLVETKPKPGTPGAKIETSIEINATDLINTLADPKNKKLLIATQNDLKKNFGYKGPTDGTWSIAFQDAIGEAETTLASLPESLKTKDLRAFIANPGVQVTSSGVGAGGPKTSIFKQATELTDAEIQEMVNKSAINLLGREINDTDKTADWYKSLSKTIKTMAKQKTITKSVKDGSTTDQITTPGYTTEKATQTIESGLKQAAPVDLARKERVDFTSWMFQQLGGSNG